jgi:hypothetical protein
MADPTYKHPGDNTPPMYYADENLKDEFKKPECIYDYLLKQIPKCPECGKLGFYKKTEEYKKLEKEAQKAAEKQQKEENKNKSKDKSKAKSNNKNDSGESDEEHSHEDGEHSCGHNHGDQESDGDKGTKPSQKGKAGKKPGQKGSKGEKQEGDSSSASSGEEGEGGEEEGSGAGHQCSDEHGCGTCGAGGKGDPDSDYVHIPYEEFGSTLDDHMDSDISEEDLAKRIHEAVASASKMAGKIPGGLEDELGELTQPKLTWQDFVRKRMQMKREGFGRNDWTRSRHKPLFAGLYAPKRKDYYVRVLFGYDTSGSMGREDIAYAVSQIVVLGERAVVNAVPWDTQVYWDALTKINKVDLEALKEVKVVGRGGTEVSALFDEYEDNVGEVDIIIVATDGYLYDNELAKVKEISKKVDVVWLITSQNPNFRPVFGRVFHLDNM